MLKYKTHGSRENRFLFFSVGEECAKPSDYHPIEKWYDETWEQNDRGKTLTSDINTVKMAKFLTGETIFIKRRKFAFRQNRCGWEKEKAKCQRSLSFPFKKERQEKNGKKKRYEGTLFLIFIWTVMKSVATPFFYYYYYYLFLFLSLSAGSPFRQLD
jgi:hypothetical protein